MSLVENHIKMNICQQLQKRIPHIGWFVCYVSFIWISFLYIDKPLAVFFHRTVTDGLYDALNLLTYLGSNKIYFLLLPTAIVFFRYVRRNRLWEQRAWFLLLVLSVACCVCLILKVSLGRARPELWFDEHLYGFFGFHTEHAYWSFPSGHTTTVMSLAFALGVLFPRYFYHVLALALMVVISRILLTQHFLSDVMMASILAWIEVTVLTMLLCKKNIQHGVLPA